MFTDLIEWLGTPVAMGAVAFAIWWIISWWNSREPRSPEPRGVSIRIRAEDKASAAFHALAAQVGDINEEARHKRATALRPVTRVQKRGYWGYDGDLLVPSAKAAEIEAWALSA